MKFCLIASLVFVQAAELPAATLTVLNINNSGPGSLRQSVIDAAASPGADIIDFAPALSGQTLVLASEIVLSMISAGNVSVDASSLPGGFTLSGGGICRIFSVSGSGGTVTLTGLTLRNGNGVGGSVSGSGGAIYKSSGTLTLERCILHSHSTNVGGAITNNNGTLTLLRCTLAGNSANAQGGAIFNGGTATLVQSTLSGNTAANEGGAIRNVGTLTLTQCTLSGNSVSGNGGAIYHTGGFSLSLTHCTLSGNAATNVGGGIVNSLSSVTLTNSIVAKNTSFNGADIYNTGSSPFGPSTVTRLGANIVQSIINIGNLASDTGPPAIIADPLLAPLGDYGGPTHTMALLAGSPARDAAMDSTFTFDQRDFPRPMEGNHIAAVVEDIGAYEAGTFDPNYNAYIWEKLPADALVAEHDAEEDYDHDGASNEDEWVMGSNPVASVPAGAAGAVTSVSLSAFSSAIIHASILRRAQGRTYTLQHSVQLTDDSWVNVPGVNPLFGSGNDFWQISINGTEPRFYRVVVKKD